MPNATSNLIVAPILGWLTLMALLVVGYLARLEFAERRKNRRLEEKRSYLNSRPLLPKAARPLAMRKVVGVSALAPDCPVLGRHFQKLDRHGALNLRPIDLN